MKHCLHCDNTYASTDIRCSTCAAQPSMHEGFESYAPQFSQAGGGFKSSYFSNLVTLEESNYWFQARNKIILWALRRYAPEFKSYLEIGCGTGFVLAAVAQNFPAAKITGSEIFTNGLSFAASRSPSAKLIQMDALSIPFVNEFDVVGAFDVLEHIEDDRNVLKQIPESVTI